MTDEAVSVEIREEICPPLLLSDDGEREGPREGGDDDSHSDRTSDDYTRCSVEAILERLRSVPLTKLSQLKELYLSDSEVLLVMLENVSTILQRLSVSGGCIYRPVDCGKFRKVIDPNLKRDCREVWHVHQVLMVEAVDRRLFSADVNAPLLSYVGDVWELFGFDRVVEDDVEDEASEVSSNTRLVGVEEV
jgi:hypothetical protein